MQARCADAGDQGAKTRASKVCEALRGQMTAASGALRGLFVGGTQPWADASGAGYVHIGHIAKDLPIWGHADIVEASINDAEGK